MVIDRPGYFYQSAHDYAKDPNYVLRNFNPDGTRRPAQSRTATPSTPSAAPAAPAPVTAAGATIAAAAFAPAAVAQSGQLPPPARAAAAAGNSPLQVAQSAMAVGEPVSVIWGRRRGTVGGVLVFPRATEARFAAGDSTVSSRYHLVLGEGRIPDIQVRDVRCGERRIGSFSQNYNQRAGSWTPGNSYSAQSTYTLPTFPSYTGGGGNYQGLSTLEAGAVFPGGSDDWRSGWNVFLRGGMIVERGRLLDSTVDSSDSIADLVLWALQRSGRAPDAMIDFPSLIAAARFTEANNLWCNGEFKDSGNLGDWLIRILPDFLLRETKVSGKFGLRPLLPTNSDGTINTGPILPAWVLTEAAIKPDSYRIEYSGAASSRPTPLAMIWRQQHDDTDVPIVRTLQVGEPNAPGPPEQHDLSQVATVEDHALRVGTYRYARRQLSTHTATVALKPGNQTGQIVEGDVVQVWLRVVTSREPAGEINHFYVVESIGHDLAGNETLSLSHFPVNSSGQSLLALAVAAATPSGTILPSNRTGNSGDLPGAASDTSVPVQSTGGTPLYEQGSGGSYWTGGATEAGGGGGGDGDGFTDPYGGAGKPQDSAPAPKPGTNTARSGGSSPISLPPGLTPNVGPGDDYPAGYFDSLNQKLANQRDTSSRLFYPSPDWPDSTSMTVTYRLTGGGYSYNGGTVGDTDTTFNVTVTRDATTGLFPVQRVHYEFFESYSIPGGCDDAYGLRLPTLSVDGGGTYLGTRGPYICRSAGQYYTPLGSIPNLYTLSIVNARRNN